jgi:hypothetical protein
VNRVHMAAVIRGLNSMRHVARRQSAVRDGDPFWDGYQRACGDAMAIMLESVRVDREIEAEGGFRLYEVRGKIRG